MTQEEVREEYRKCVESFKYWNKLKHQAAIAAMQGTISILSSSDRYAFTEIVADNYTGKEKTYPNEIAEFATACAESLIEKLKGVIVDKEDLYTEDRLKSLHPQPHWKPSDDEMKALHDLNLTGNLSYVGQGQVLIDLYNALKNLI